jgi:hypothetical protein
LGVFSLETIPIRKKTKKHFVRNKGKYFAGGICLLIGGVIGLYASRYKRIDVVTSIPDPISQIAASFIDDGGDIINHIGRNGHPGNVIYCNETQQIFRSHREATRELGINSRDLWAYLKGLKANARGYTFKKLGEANKSLFEDVTG